MNFNELQVNTSAFDLWTILKLPEAALDCNKKKAKLFTSRFLCCLQVEEIAQLRSSLQEAEWELQCDVRVQWRRQRVTDCLPVCLFQWSVKLRFWVESKVELMESCKLLCKEGMLISCRLVWVMKMMVWHFCERDVHRVVIINSTHCHVTFQLLSLRFSLLNTNLERREMISQTAMDLMRTPSSVRVWANFGSLIPCWLCYLLLSHRSFSSLDHNLFISHHNFSSVFRFSAVFRLLSCAFMALWRSKSLDFCIEALVTAIHIYLKFLANTWRQLI